MTGHIGLLEKKAPDNRMLKSDPVSRYRYGKSMIKSIFQEEVLKRG